MPVKCGSGCDIEGLTNVYTVNDVWAALVLKQRRHRVDSTTSMRALGFCVGVDHARFRARFFNEHGIEAAAVWGDGPKQERAEALAKLRRGEIRILFSIDLCHEGVDVPHVETLLLPRPTESAVLFLQQLGRGLRKAEGKTSCLVLDVIGRHRREFRFHPRLQGLLGGSRRHAEEQVTQGLPCLPAGRLMELEPVARDIMLRSIRDAVPARWMRRQESCAGWRTRAGPAAVCPAPAFKFVLRPPETPRDPAPTRGRPVEEERVIWKGRPSPVDELPTLVACGLFLWLVIPGFVAAWRILELLCTRYTLSNERLTVETGVLSKRLDEIELYRVKDTALEMPLHLRLFGRAHVVLFTSDRSHPVLRLRAVADPEMIRNQVRGLVEKRRERKGVRELDV